MFTCDSIINSTISNNTISNSNRKANPFRTDRPCLDSLQRWVEDTRLPREDVTGQQHNVHAGG